MSYRTIASGSPHSLGFKLFAKAQNGKPISFWHDIPLYANKEKTILNMVVEIPRWSNAKMEISKSEKLNPIVQDVKKGQLRYVHNIFPHKGYIWNYGAFPQTYEDPDHIDPDTGCKGDCDPLDVLEIGHRVKASGEVIQVKVLGLQALLDEGETDWKILAIDVKDPLANLVNDISDVEKHFPGLLQATTEWFRYYKVPAGKPENEFAFDGQAKNKAFAEKIIKETNLAWEGLLKGQVASGKTSLHNIAASLGPKLSPSDLDSFQASLPAPAAPQPIDASVDAWHFVIPPRQ